MSTMDSSGARDAINASDVRGVSKKLSWLLRHGANEAGLTMDAAGWAEVEDVRRVLHIGREALLAAVEHNNKQRLELLGSRIRASQGHSLAGMPVTRDALEATWRVHDGEAPVFHGTRVSVLEQIAREGILPGERTHAHLAEAIDSTVGKRASVDVMLEVSPACLRAAGVALHRSPNGVLLARFVPPSAIVGLVPIAARARQSERELCALFGLTSGRPRTES